ncbi:MAG: PD-(D/E)XK nuclease family protein [Bacteroidia bacterium]|nr:PD-(D/E)XK nuclease family protein [Bacteroidia bacterium]
MTFLEQIVGELKQEFGKNISNICIVVPTRRAVVFLRNALAKTYRQTLWAPRMISIQDFVRELSGWDFPEMLPLVFELYQVYLRRKRQDDPTWYEPFERFYAWGEMLVKDFDEIDKYYVNAEKLFTNIKDLKEIDNFFQFSPEELEHIKRFWTALRGKNEDLTEVQEEFLRIWQILNDIYEGFKQQLASRHQAFDGMAYRFLVDRIQEGRLNIPYDQVIFAGFNALSRSEELIMESLLKEKKAIVYWDVDRTYFTPPGEKKASQKSYSDVNHIAGEEPGKFIKEYHSKWKDLESRLIYHDMTAREKDIYITGVALQVGQARYLGQQLQALQLEESQPHDHAIVLADEQMLFPVLYSLPSELESLNITMGFPLKQTNIFHLIMSVLRLLRTLKFDAFQQLVFTHQEVLTILNNPYIKAQKPELSLKVQREINEKNLVFVSKNFLAQQDFTNLLKHIFQPPIKQENSFESLEAILNYISQIFDLLLRETASSFNRLESEFVVQFHTQFNQLREVLLHYQPSLSLAGFTQLLREALQRSRIPFEGEPLEGIQLMGFLETRVLDFKKVFVMGANEGNLPDTSKGNSFIPYSLRKGFGLPTYEEKDSIYAYHFYRLLQRTEEVHLIYNTVVQDRGGTREISRFIRQIRYFFRETPNLKIHERIITTPSPYSQSQPILIQQNEDIKKILHSKYLDQSGNSKSYLSATAMTTYLGCPLKFYFRYIAGIRESDSVEENIEANTFGSVLHYTLELLYKEMLNRPIEKDAIKELRQNLGSKLKQAFEAHKLPWNEELRGMNYLYRDVIRQQVGRILTQDANGDAFKVISLEDEEKFFTSFDIGGKKVKINGMLDRIDLLAQSDTVRIIDYKTGTVKLKDHIQVHECFEGVKYKEVFQGFLYAWLYKRQYSDAKVKVGYYTVRELSKGIRFIQNGNAVSNAELAQFEDLLKELIVKILSGDYSQTEDESYCRFCSYKGICNRGR